MASSLKLDKSQIHLRISYGSERKKQGKVKGRWPGSSQPSSYSFPQGKVKISSANDIFSAAFKAEEEIFLREIEMSIKIQQRQKGKVNFNGCFPGSPAVCISDGQTLILLKRNKKMNQHIRFINRGLFLKIIWEFNCFLPSSGILTLDPIQLKQKSGGLLPGPGKMAYEPSSARAQTMWIAPQESLRGIRVKDLEDNLGWMEKERFFFDIIRLEKIHNKTGDWDSLHTDYRGKIGFINRRIEHNGMIPALGFEPFYADCDSELVRQHPDWLLPNMKGDPLTVSLNRQRKIHILDFTQLEVKDYLEKSINIFRKQWGFRSFHLQGLAALLIPGQHSDNSIETGKILYSALDFFRTVLGKNCFITAEDLPLITEKKLLNMINISPGPGNNRKSRIHIPQAIYRFLEIRSLSNFPWILNGGNYPLPEEENHKLKQAGESYRQMLLIGGGILSMSINLCSLTDKQTEELNKLIPSFKKFSQGVLQQLTCPQINEASIVYNSAGYLGVFNLSSKKQQIILNMESLKQEIHNRTGESAIKEGRTAMKTGELELLLPPLGSRIFKF